MTAKEFFDTLQRAEISAPSLELMALLALLAVCLVFRATRVGLMLAYLFAFRWGWLFFNHTFGRDQQAYLYGYTICGVIVLLLGIISLLQGEQ